METEAAWRRMEHGEGSEHGLGGSRWRMRRSREEPDSYDALSHGRLLVAAGGSRGGATAAVVRQGGRGQRRQT